MDIFATIIVTAAQAKAAREAAAQIPGGDGWGVVLQSYPECTCVGECTGHALKAVLINLYDASAVPKALGQYAIPAPATPNNVRA